MIRLRRMTHDETTRPKRSGGYTKTAGPFRCFSTNSIPSIPRPVGGSLRVNSHFCPRYSRRQEASPDAKATSGQSEVRECDDRKLRTIALLTALGTPDLMAPGAGCGLIRQQGGVVLPVTHDTERATKQRIRETNNTPSRTPAAQSRHYGKTGRWA